MKIWGKSSSEKCFLCYKQGSLHHILSNCETALRQKRYTWRHDSVLKTLEGQLAPFLEKVNKSPVKKKILPKIKFVKQGARGEKTKVKTRRPTLLDGANDWKWIFDYDDDQYTFPAHIVTTDERPDVLIYSDSLRSVILIELTCPAEEGILNARERKVAKYHETLIPLIKAQKGGWSVT